MAGMNLLQNLVNETLPRVDFRTHSPFLSLALSNGPNFRMNQPETSQKPEPERVQQQEEVKILPIQYIQPYVGTGGQQAQPPQFVQLSLPPAAMTGAPTASGLQMALQQQLVSQLSQLIMQQQQLPSNPVNNLLRTASSSPSATYAKYIRPFKMAPVATYETDTTGPPVTTSSTPVTKEDMDDIDQVPIVSRD
ncbi:hypothetical protein HDE_14012 [Halotydeus destructor]|nr:hypothetical protein HDE_14012 [Halotydeus destructor]